MFKRNYRKIFLSLFLLLIVFSPLVTSAQFGPGGLWNTPDFRKQLEEMVAEKNNKQLPLNCKVYSKLLVMNDGGWGFDFECMLAKFSYGAVYRPTAFLFSQSGRLFEFVVEETVLKMADNFYPNGQNSAIDSTWVIFRDLANILFIFVLLYFSILTIISGTGKTGKMIATLIVVALLINFSLFFTKVVIDISNTASLSLYNSILSINRADGDLPLLQDDEILKTGIASPFIAKTKIASLLEGKDMGLMQIAIQLTLGAMLLIFLAIILFSMSLMLISRFIILMFVLMVSSIAFGSYILPQLKSKIFDRWLSVLIGQSLFAPLFLLCLYVSIMILNNIPSLGGDETSTGWSDVLHTSKELILVYILVLGFLAASLKISKSLADQGGSHSSTMSGFMGRTAVGLAGFASGFALRNSVGRASNALAQSHRVPVWANKTGEYLNGSWDIRNSTKVRKVAGLAGLDLKGVKKGNYKSIQDDADKRHKARVKKSGELTRRERESIDNWNRTKVGKNRDNINDLENLEKNGKKISMMKREIEFKLSELEKRGKISNITEKEKKSIEINRTKLNKQLEAVKRKEEENQLTVASVESMLGEKVLSAREAAKKAKDAGEAREAAFVNKKDGGGWTASGRAGREYARQYRNKKANKKDKVDELTETVAELRKSIEDK